MDDVLIKEKLEILKVSMYEELNRLKANILKDSQYCEKAPDEGNQIYMDGSKLKKHKRSFRISGPRNPRHYK